MIYNNATLTFDPGSGNTTYSGAISGAGTVTKAGTGIFAINGTNSFTGTLDVMAGVLKLNSFNNNSMIFSSTNVLVESGATLLEDFNNNYQTLTLTNVTLNGGTLQAGGGSYGMNQIAINGYLAIGTNGGTYSTATSYGPDGNPVNGVLSGSGPLTVRCDNRGAYNQRSLTLNNSSNTYSGIMTLNNNAASIYTAYGLLQLGTSNAVRYATLNLAQTNAEPNVVAFSSGVTSATVGGLIGGRYNVGIELKNLGGAAVALTVNNSESNQFNGVISGSNGCSLVKANTGVLILAGTNTYTGVTLVQGGTLVLAAPLAGSSVLVVSNSMLSLGAANVVTVTTNLTLSGATLDMGANTNTVSSALTVATGGSTILLSDAALAFPDSSSKTWTGTLNLSGVLKPHTLRFGTDAAGLTLSQKGRIRYRNSGATLDSQGYVVPYGATLIIVQ